MKVVSQGKKVVRPISASLYQDTSLASHITPMCIVPKPQCIDQSNKIDISTCLVDMHLVVHIYTSSIQKLVLLRSLKQMSLDCMVKDVSHVLPVCPSDKMANDCPVKNIQQRLHECGLVLSPSPKDGDCFFSQCPQVSYSMHNLGLLL